jgi:hypothetical protein
LHYIEGMLINQGKKKDHDEDEQYVQQ